MGKEKEYPMAVKWASFIVPVALIVGLLALFVDLHHKLYFWRLYTVIRLQSPMSWGAWTLMAITPLSMLWAASFVSELFPAWDWRLPILKTAEKLVISYRKYIAYAMLGLSVILGIYTGILLSAFNSRPLWNTSILGPLFLTSGFSTAAATIVLLSKSHIERALFSKIDLGLIAVELFLIVHLFMGFLAGSQTSLEAANLFLGGEFTLVFWVFVVLLGLIIPFALELMELRGYKIPVLIPTLLVILGGLLFRFVMVDAGQLTRYLY
jgi:formate-dependent nitrite reductase membrane component NrfD